MLASHWFFLSLPLLSSPLSLPLPLSPYLPLPLPLPLPPSISDSLFLTHPHSLSHPHSLTPFLMRTHHTGPTIPAYVKGKVKEMRRAYTSRRDRRTEADMRAELDRVTYRIPSFHPGSAQDEGDVDDASSVSGDAEGGGEGGDGVAGGQRPVAPHHNHYRGRHYHHTHEQYSPVLPQTDGERILLKVKKQLERRHGRIAAWDDAWQQIDEEIVDGDHQVEVIDDQRLGQLECHVASLLISVKALQVSMVSPLSAVTLCVYGSLSLSLAFARSRLETRARYRMQAGGRQHLRQRITTPISLSPTPSTWLIRMRFATHISLLMLIVCMH